MRDQYQYTVCTRCFTYNHAPFIKDTLDGFTMQRTKSPVVYVIVDDCSSDGEEEVISGYIKENFNLADPITTRKEETEDYVLTFAQHLRNKNCFFAVLFLKYRHWGKKPKQSYIVEWENNSKYLANCEGDDYWIDENKLQQQVDFLDNHPNYVLTCHRYKIFDYEANTWSSDHHDSIFEGNIPGISFDYEHNKPWKTKTLSLVFRAEAIEECKKFKGGLDAIVVYFLMKHGLGYCFNQVWGVYRLNKKSIFGKQSLLNKKLLLYRSIKKLYFYDPNPTTRRLYYNNYSSVLFLSKGKILFQEKFELLKFLAAFYYALKKAYRYVRKEDKSGYRSNWD